MEQSPSCEANRFSASQEIPRILRNPKVHYCIHKSPSPVPILNNIYPVHALYLTFRRFILISSIYSSIFQVVSFPSGFLTKALYAPLLSPIRATWFASLNLLDLITRRLFGYEYRT
jgi:hypothetical protein